MASPSLAVWNPQDSFFLSDAVIPSCIRAESTRLNFAGSRDVRRTKIVLHKGLEIQAFMELICRSPPALDPLPGPSRHPSLAPEQAPPVPVLSSGRGRAVSSIVC